MANPYLSVGVFWGQNLNMSINAYNYSFKLEEFSFKNLIDVYNLTTNLLYSKLQVKPNIFTSADDQTELTLVHYIC